MIFNVLAHQHVAMLRAEDDELVQALLLQALDEPLDEGVLVFGSAVSVPQQLDASRLEYLVEGPGELGVTVTPQLLWYNCNTSES
jgi:hypothetical protein